LLGSPEWSGPSSYTGTMVACIKTPWDDKKCLIKKGLEEDRIEGIVRGAFKKFGNTYLIIEHEKNGVRHINIDSIDDIYFKEEEQQDNLKLIN